MGLISWTLRSGSEHQGHSRLLSFSPCSTGAHQAHNYQQSTIAATPELTVYHYLKDVWNKVVIAHNFATTRRIQMLRFNFAPEVKENYFHQVFRIRFDPLLLGFPDPETL
jgi:hypothetical protein